MLLTAPLPVVLLAWASPALPHAGNSNPDDIHACVGRHSHLVRIVGVDGRCARYPRFRAETAVHWPGIASAPAPAPTPAAAPLRFVDVNGTLIGLAIAPDRVVIDRGSEGLITVALSRSGFQQSASPEAFLYENPDCPAGEELLSADAASNFATVTGSIAVYRDFSAVRLATIQSVLLPGFPCDNSFALGPILVAPALTFDLATLGLVPPFTLAQ
jgi:hypothetical protein